jgi:hypothetical protein
MIKIQIKEEDIQAAKRFLSKQPGADSLIHDPAAQALKRTLARDPRWCRPYVLDGFVFLAPRSKYPKLRPLQIPVSRKVMAHCLSFDNWFVKKNFKGQGPKPIEFNIKNYSLVDGRIQKK